MQESGKGRGDPQVQRQHPSGPWGAATPALHNSSAQPSPFIPLQTKAVTQHTDHSCQQALVRQPRQDLGSCSGSHSSPWEDTQPVSVRGSAELLQAVLNHPVDKLTPALPCQARRTTARCCTLHCARARLASASASPPSSPAPSARFSGTAAPKSHREVSQCRLCL